MGRELEFKYGIKGHDEFDQIKSILQSEFRGDWQRINMDSSYFDTAARHLARNQWTLRIRSENHNSILTCKVPRNDGSRGEWAVENVSLPNGLMALVRKGAPEALMDLYSVPLRPICSARFTRICRLAEIPGATVEIALDRGILMGSSKEMPFWELEVELKEGSDEAVRQWSQAFAEENGLKPEPRSKFSRAVALAL